jgi:O-antigen/teichoic acid export membrane protein
VVLVAVSLLSYPAGTSTIVLVVCLGLYPYSLSAVYEGVFQAHERMAYIVRANAPTALLRVVLAFVILARGSGLVPLVTMLVGSWVAVAVIEWWLLRRNITSERGRFDPAIARSLGRAALPFVGIEGLVALLSSINVLLLSKFGNVDDVGLYSAANQLTTPMMLVIQSVALSVFPMMCRHYRSDVRKLARTAESAMAVLIAVTLAIVVAGAFVAREVLVLLYHDPKFGDAANVLRIALWQLVAMAATAILGQVLYASGRERVNLRIVVIDAVLAVVLGVVLIQHFGIIGAAVAALVVKAIDLVLHYAPASKLVSGLSLPRLLWCPAAAAACLVVVVAALRGLGLGVALACAIPVYLIVDFTLEAWAAGGVHALRSRFSHVWSES